MQPAPKAPIGFIHDWYPTDNARYNDLQRLNFERARIDIPILQTGECLHGVGSYNQSMFPQSIGMAASFDTDLVHRVARAIGVEASSIGIRACFAPVLDLGKDPRFGRVQEAWGEDVVLTSNMGVAYASGLSKNKSWSDSDAVAPIMKHFAGYGSPQGGLNGAPFMGYGLRDIYQEMLVPFKAALELGGVKGVMMAYNEIDDVPCHLNPLLHEVLREWEFDGYVTADDSGLVQLLNVHRVTSSVADTIAQWQNAGGMVQYYDFPLEDYVKATLDLVANGTLDKEILQSHVRRILGVKYDLGLFEERYIADHIDPFEIAAGHAPLTLEAAQKTIVLLENQNGTLPLEPVKQSISKIALIGPFGDTFNYGDYSGQWGGSPITNATTLRQGMLQYLTKHSPETELVSGWGANSWTYNGQYNIPPYHLSANGSPGGLLATYYADSDFGEAKFQKLESPSLHWGLYPPKGLPSNNFSVVWEGKLDVPVDVAEIDGWLGVAVYANTSAKLFVDGEMFIHAESTTSGNILSNIPGFSYSKLNATTPPPGSSPFIFRKGATHEIRLEYRAWNDGQHFGHMSTLNAQVLLFWNLVDRRNPIEKAVEVAQSSDIIILAVGAGWNSDGESGDRATLGLSLNQTALADAMFSLQKPVILVLQGGRPFAIPNYYKKAAAVLNTFFPGQSGGQAISDVIFGLSNPGGRVPISVPYSVGTLPVFYNYKPTFPRDYTDTQFGPIYPFGYGLSYTSFTISNFTASQAPSTTSSMPLPFNESDDIEATNTDSFTPASTLHFTLTITNTGNLPGSDVPQVYLLNNQHHPRGGASSITRPVRQLVAFTRVYLSPGESRTVTLDLDVSRFLAVLDRQYNWTVERGEYVFGLMEHGGEGADMHGSVTLRCVH